jgi:hypothetical protein
LATFVERFVPKVAGVQGSITEAGKESLSSPESGAWVEFEQGTNLQEAIEPLTPPTLPSEVFNLPDRIENSVREATGVNELMRGLFPDRKRTATETSEVVSASAARQAEKRNRLEEFYREIARRMLMYMQMFYDGPRIARFVEHQGDVVWQYTAEDITMDAELEISLTPKIEETAQTREDRATVLFNLLGQADPNLVNKAGLYTKGLKLMGLRMDEIAEIINLPDQQQVAQQQQNQQIAAQADAAQQGVARPDMVGGPLSGQALALAANQGEVPPEVLAAANGIGPGSPQAVEQVSESKGEAVP